MFEFDSGLKEIFELVLVIVLIGVFYSTYKFYLLIDINAKKNYIDFWHKLSLVFLFFLIAYIFELLDSFVSGLFGDFLDISVVVFTILAFIYLFLLFNKHYLVLRNEI